MNSADKKERRLLKLFATCFGISATNNGGFAIVSMMKEYFVRRYGWLKEDEVMDLVSIAQSSPGPIAINGAVLVGYRIAGLPGAFCAVAGTALPPLIIMTLVTLFFEKVSSNPYVRFFMKGMAAGVAALLVSITVDLIKGTAQKKSALLDVMMAAAFLISFFTGLSKFWLALACAVLGVARVLTLRKKAEKGGGTE